MIFKNDNIELSTAILFVRAFTVELTKDSESDFHPTKMKSETNRTHVAFYFPHNESFLSGVLYITARTEAAWEEGIYSGLRWIRSGEYAEKLDEAWSNSRRERRRKRGIKAYAS